MLYGRWKLFLEWLGSRKDMVGGGGGLRCNHIQINHRNNSHLFFLLEEN